MWSGPRNISTAMMRSWEARGDTAVVDEPLYAHYLLRTGLDHPGAAEVIACHETDFDRVVATLTGPAPGEPAIQYQKHMTHHLLPGMDTSWVCALTNCFLIRDPGPMLISLAKVLPNPTLEATGLPQQVELFERERARLGRTPPVIDAWDVLSDPARTLALLCAATGVPYTDRMLSWPAGPRTTDGVWARHWYAAVEKSTGFGPPERRDEPVPERLAPLLRQCQPLYESLHAHRLR